VSGQLKQTENGRRAEVIINGIDKYEDLLGVSSLLCHIASDAGFATTRHLGMWRFDSPVAAPDVYVLYIARGAFTVAQQNALVRRVRTGTGLLALHTTNVFPNDAGRVRDERRVIWQLIGSRFMGFGPAPYESRFRVRLEHNHPITAGLNDFDVTHEHYHIELDDPTAAVLAVRTTSTSPEPILYVREEGYGRVCYLQLGHDVRVWDEPGVRELFVRSLLWCGDCL
jgi:uncharacterized protein